MELDKKTLNRLDGLFYDKWVEIRNRAFKENKYDRKNVSAHWNKYLSNYQIRLITDVAKKKFENAQNHIHKNLINLVNRGELNNCILLKNPDRDGQLLIVSRDIAERVLVFGMI